jgi:uncharacterized membrane protein
MPHAKKSVTINRPREELYRFWRNFENLPRLVEHLQSVDDLGNGRSRWVVTAAGRTFQWEAEIVKDVPNELISWRSLPNSEIPNSGSVRFRTSSRGSGTEVTVDLKYEVPGGNVVAMLAKMVGEGPGQQLRDVLRRFKQIAESVENAKQLQGQLTSQ